MSPRIRTGPEPVLAAHAPLPPAAAATAQAKPDQVPITEQNFSHRSVKVAGELQAAQIANGTCHSHVLTTSSMNATRWQGL